MSQQLQQPQAGYQAQTQAGQSLQQSAVGQFVGQQYRQTTPQESQKAVADLDQFETVCEWAASRAAERNMTRVAQRCADLADLAHLEKKLIVRQSPFAEPVGQAVKQTIQQGMQEFQQYASEPEVQEALSQAQQTHETISHALGRVQSFGQQGMHQGGQQGML